MLLDIFLGLDADLIDTDEVAAVHREGGLRLVSSQAAASVPPGQVYALECAGERDPDSLVVELIRLAAIGRLVLRTASTAPQRPVGYIVRTAQDQDRALLLRLGAVKPTHQQPPGPPELNPLDGGRDHG